MPLRGERRDRPTYTILGDLPDGKGKIILANHEILGRKCVQKMVDLHGATGSLAFLEPRLMDKIHHDHITPIAEVQWDPQRDDCITFIMRFYEGGSVHQNLQRGQRFSIRETIAIATDVLDALAYLHVETRVIHRDVKPGNVFLEVERNRGFLGDLGSAALIEADGSVPAAKQTLIYTPPESLSGGRVGVEGDVYATGMTIYEMLTGSMPYPKIDLLNATQRLATRKHAVPDSWLERWPPHVPDLLRRVVRKALRTDPTKRHRSARALLNDLNRIPYIDWKHENGEALEGEWIGTWPPGLLEARRTTFRVTSRTLKKGSDHGKLRLVATYRRPGANWRRLLPDATVERTDAASVTQYFATVAERAAQRFAAR